MESRRSVDPRFDPRFQRGYDGTPIDGAAAGEVPTPRTPVVMDSPAVDEGQNRSPSISDAVVGPADAVDLAELDETDDVDGPDEVAEPAFNPFRLALLLVSVGMLALAASLLWWAAENQAAYLNGSMYQQPADWMFQQIVTVVPPAGIIVGFVGIALWIGLGALRSLRIAAAGAGDDE